MWLGLLATAMIAGSAPAAIVTYSGNGYNFFNYDTGTGTGLTNNAGPSNISLNNGIWDYDQVSLLNGTRSNNVHFQQYPAAGTELMDGNYTHGANNNSPDWTPDITGGDTNNAQVNQIWDSEQLFWSYVGNGTSGTLNIGIVTGFQSAGRDGYGAGDLFLAFGGSTIGLPNTGELGGATGTQGFYELAIGTGDGRNTGSSEWVLDSEWADADSNPFDLESDPYRYNNDVSPLNVVQTNIADVQWTQNVANNQHNFLAVALHLDGSQAGAAGLRDQNWIAQLLATGGGFTAHWTYGCGNDTVHYTAITSTPYDNVVPVPAAAPLAMLGMAIVGVVRRKRQSKN